MGAIKSNSLSVLLLGDGVRTNPYPVYTNVSSSAEYYIVSSNNIDCDGVFYGYSENVIGIDTVTPEGNVFVNPFIETTSGTEAENFNHLLYSTSSSIEFSNSINRIRHKTIDGSSEDVISLSQGNWSISSESLLTNDSGQLEEILDKLNSKSYAIVAFKYGDNMWFVGQAMVESASLGSGVNDIGTFSVTFKGYGPLYNASQEFFYAGGTQTYDIQVQGLPYPWYRIVGPTGVSPYVEGIPKFENLSGMSDSNTEVRLGQFVDINYKNKDTPDDPDWYAIDAPLEYESIGDVTKGVTMAEYSNVLNNTGTSYSVDPSNALYTIVNGTGRKDHHYGGYSVTTGPNSLTTNIYRKGSSYQPESSENTFFYPEQPHLNVNAWGSGYDLRWVLNSVTIHYYEPAVLGGYVTYESAISGDLSLDDKFRILGVAPALPGQSAPRLISQWTTEHGYAESVETPSEMAFAYLGSNTAENDELESNSLAKSIISLTANFTPILFDDNNDEVERYDGEDGNSDGTYEIIYRNHAKHRGDDFYSWVSITATLNSLQPFGNLGTYYPRYRITNSSGSPIYAAYSGFLSQGLPSGNWDGVLKIRNFIVDGADGNGILQDYGTTKFQTDSSGHMLAIKRFQKIKEVRLYVDETQGYDTYTDTTQTASGRTDYILLHQGQTGYGGAVSFGRTDYHLNRPVDDDTSTREVTVNFNDFTIFDNQPAPVDINHATYLSIIYRFVYTVQTTDDENTAQANRPQVAEATTFEFPITGFDVPLVVPINLP